MADSQVLAPMEFDDVDLSIFDTPNTTDDDKPLFQNPALPGDDNIDLTVLELNTSPDDGAMEQSFVAPDAFSAESVAPVVESAVSPAESDSSSRDAEAVPEKPKFALNLGQSSLSKPAKEAARERAKAMQEKFIKRFTEKNADQATSPPAGVPYPHNVGESGALVPSDAPLQAYDNESGASAASGLPFPHDLDERSGSEVFFPSDFNKNDPEAVEFEKIRAAYVLKKKAGTCDLASDVAFTRAEIKEKARLRKADNDEFYEREPSPDESEPGLFVTPGDTTPASHVPGGETPMRSETASTKGGFFTNGGKRTSKRKADAPAAGDMAPPSKKRAKKAKVPTGRSLGKGKGGTGISPEELETTINAIKGNAKKKQAAPRKGHNISNVKSLLTGTDVFKDAEAVAGHSNQPGFKPGQTVRQKALRDLIANVQPDDRAAAGGDRKFLENSLKDFDGQGSCKPSADGSGWTLRGMNCTLKHYQVLGVAFMRRRENQETHPRGGILADEMGLGKTIQMIANIINGKPKQNQPKTTLIVASPALISQWATEINKFAQTRKENRKHGIQRVIQHRFGYRQGGTDDDIREAIQDSDICLTTYGDIVKSYPKAEVPPELTSDRAKADWWRQHFHENKGVFHNIKFLRIVLDEAQAIKNHTSHCSMACRALKSEYYWAISGTPLVNGVTEMYPYLKFLRHPHTGSMRTFQANFCSVNDPTGSEKLGVFMRQIIIRRTHKDLLFGARLLDLPTPKQNVIYLEFNGVERSVYEIVKQRFIQRINTVCRREGIQSQYSCIWTMLLRLRQICSHVLLIQDTILDLLEREDFEKLNDITREWQDESKDTQEVLAHLSHMLKVHVLAANTEAASGNTAGIDIDIVPGSFNNVGGAAPNLGKKHGKTYDFQKYLAAAAQTEEMAIINARAQCCSCRKLPVMPQVTSCHHIYCKVCIRDLQHAAARTGHAAARCSECGDKFHSVQEARNGIEPHETENSSGDGSEANGVGRKKAKKPANPLDWISQPGQILPSAKTVAAKAQIINWLTENPNCKIIVYTQFLPMIRIMGKVCHAEGWGHLKYSGTMSHTARERALKDFGEKPDVRVLLMSLKCGGLGLNITAASRVILMDPWWNDAVEQQAFCRVFRIGQTSETRLTRLCIKNSIDAAMFAVKERKTAEIEKVMDKTKDTNEPMTTHDLLKLFGNEVGEDDEGHPYIFPEAEEQQDDDVPPFYEMEDRGMTFGRRG